MPSLADDERDFALAFLNFKAWRAKRNIPPPVLGEQDILSAFRQLATWLAGKNLHAEAIVSGGASMIMQTHLRKDQGTKDIDLAFREITSYAHQDEGFPYDPLVEENGKAFLQIDAKNILFEEFRREHSSIPLCKDYWNAFINPRSREDGFVAPDWNECLPGISILDANGNGLDVRISTLQHIALSKQRTLQKANGGTDYKEYQNVLQDLYGIYALNRREWNIPTLTSVDQKEEILQRANLGFKQLPLPDIRIEL